MLDGDERAAVTELRVVANTQTLRALIDWSYDLLFDDEYTIKASDANTISVELKRSLVDRFHEADRDPALEANLDRLGERLEPLHLDRSQIHPRPRSGRLAGESDATPASRPGA